MVETHLHMNGKIQYVSYSRLCPSPLNVRKRAPTGIESLAETIAAQGVCKTWSFTK